MYLQVLIHVTSLHISYLVLCATADNYLLQIQPYNFTSSKAKSEAKPEGSKAESDEPAVPAGGVKEAVPQWYDVDVVRGTQYTVSGYNVKVDTPTEQGQEVRGQTMYCRFSCTPECNSVCIIQKQGSPAPPSVIVCVLYRNKGPLHPRV